MMSFLKNYLYSAKKTIKSSAKETELDSDKIDKLLDAIVIIGGSGWTFLVINLLLIGWVIGLVPTKASVSWQSVISDVQAIGCYIYDSLLMRQQIQENERLLLISGSLRSRMKNITRMMQNYNARESRHTENFRFKVPDNIALPEESIYDKIATGCSRWLGSLYAIIIYWLGIFVWLGFGQYCHWSNEWQLYINSATSALMIFIFVFLANVRERNKKFIMNCFSKIQETEIKAEEILRKLTDDSEGREIIIISPSPSNRAERLIDVYAQIVGRLVGIIVVIIVLIVWIAIGPIMHFDGNWFLISGTYAGLVGLFDGFVLRNSYARSSRYEEINFDKVNKVDEAAFQKIGLPFPEQTKHKFTFSEGIAVRISSVFASQWTVLVGLICIIGLIIAASALKWSVTGQLVCNVPPSLIESFFMMVLITAHSVSDQLRRNEVHNIYIRRQIILEYLVFLKEDVLQVLVAPISDTEQNSGDE